MPDPVTAPVTDEVTAQPAVEAASPQASSSPHPADPALIERLKAHQALGSAPIKELTWLAEHGSLLTYQQGERLSAKDQPVIGTNIVLSGSLALFIDRGKGPYKAAEWRAGDITGVLPYSRVVSAPGIITALEPVEIFCIDRQYLQAMAQECFEVTSILVHTMLDRARLFTSADLHNEKMVSLGKLSAGLAHELNNPASAIERCASQLEDRIDELEFACRALGSACLAPSAQAAIETLRAACEGSPAARPASRSALDQADHEDAIADWLAAHGVDCCSPTQLSDTSVTLAALDAFAATVDAHTLNLGLRWAAVSCAVHSMTSTMQDAAMRISGLVTAVKGFTHMDQAMVPQAVNLRQSLENTVTVLNARARDKCAQISVELPANLPHALGFAAELNQVWGNLIENAFDAIPVAGCVQVRAGTVGDQVIVRIADNGPGIPKDIQPRIFDPFFTTKPMGEGTGLGLDIVQRLVRHNDGAIDFESTPGRTEFRVTLPIAGSAS